MKKIICIILTVLMAFSALPINAANDYEKVLSRITPFKLLDVKESDAPVTRGEAVRALVKILVRTDLANDGLVPPFADVSADSEIAPYVNYAHTLGFLSGVDGTHFAPDSPITAQQFIKVAVSVLGYKLQAEKEGGYPNGYISVALRLKLLDGVKYTADNFTFEAAVRIIDNMMDAKTLEAVYDLDKFELSEESLYIQMLQRGDLKAIKGIVTAVGKSTLKGFAELEKGEISVNGEVMEYPHPDISMLGKKVIVSVREDSTTKLPFVESLYEENLNEEVVVNARDLTSLDVNEAVWYDEENRKTEIINFETPSVIYNGKLLTVGEEAQISIPPAGSIRALDNDGDSRYEVVFIDEYESLFVDRIINKNNAIYFKDDLTFRGLRGISLDFDDDDKDISILSTNGNEIEFSEIKENSVVSIFASKDLNTVKVIVSDETMEGKITAKGDDMEIFIDDKEMPLYQPIAASFLQKYELGQTCNLALNHNGEIVGVAVEPVRDGEYGFAVGFGKKGGIRSNAQIKIVKSGIKEKKVEEKALTTEISYNFLNGDMEIYDFADKVTWIDFYGNESRVNSNDLQASDFYRAAVFFKLDNEGKIKNIEAYSLPEYETAKQPAYYDYYFNSVNASFGGYSFKDAFYIGESTRVICVPIKSSPVDDDYNVDVTITDGSRYTVMPVNIDVDTQIAECVALVVKMDSTEVKPIQATDDVAVIGKAKRVRDEASGFYNYTFEVLKGENVETIYLSEDSLVESTAQTLRAGDLIKFNKKLSGEVGNIEYLESLSALGDTYYINRADSENEVVYAPVKDIEVNRLDNELNEKVDYLTITVDGRDRFYTVLREDGAMIYTYDRESGDVSAATSDEILADVSKVFMMVNNREPLVIVNIIN